MGDTFAERMPHLAGTRSRRRYGSAVSWSRYASRASSVLGRAALRIGRPRRAGRRRRRSAVVVALDREESIEPGEHEQRPHVLVQVGDPQLADVLANDLRERDEEPEPRAVDVVGVAEVEADVCAPRASSASSSLRSSWRSFATSSSTMCTVLTSSERSIEKVMDSSLLAPARRPALPANLPGGRSKGKPAAIQSALPAS